MKLNQHAKLITKRIRVINKRDIIFHKNFIQYLLKLPFFHTRLEELIVPGGK